MFKVICVTQENFAPHLPNDVVDEPKVGDIVTVIGERTGKYGIRYYSFEEWPEYDYDVRNFSRIDGPDERERLEVWQSERLTIEDKLLMALADSMPEVEMSEEATARLWKGIQAHLNAPHE